MKKQTLGWSIYLSSARGAVERVENSMLVTTAGTPDLKNRLRQRRFWRPCALARTKNRRPSSASNTMREENWGSSSDLLLESGAQPGRVRTPIADATQRFGARDLLER